MSDGMRDRNGPDEAELLRTARELMPAVDAEPRPGFAARVALRATDEHAKPFGAPWWRFAFAGGTVAAAAAALMLALGPTAPSLVNPAQPVSVASNDTHSLLRAQGADLALAQRLDLYEELSLAQNEDALDDLEVVAQLHTLHAEAKP